MILNINHILFQHTFFFRSLMTINQAIRQIYQNNIFKANALKPLTVGQVEIKIMEPTRIKGTHLY